MMYFANENIFAQKFIARKVILFRNSAFMFFTLNNIEMHFKNFRVFGLGHRTRNREEII